jgi:hypothetical protein
LRLSCVAAHHWWHLTLWDTRHDTFRPGQWLRARLYPEKCDLSPMANCSYIPLENSTSARRPLDDDSPFTIPHAVCAVSRHQ